MSEILFAAEIAFRRLDRCMSQQELNLLQFTPTAVAQLRTGSPQVVRCNMLQARSLAAGLDYVPHNILRDAFPPHLSRPGNGSKDPALRDPGCQRPLIERGLDTFGNGNGADVAALANQIHRRRVTLPHLDLIQLQADQLRSTKATTKQHGQHGIVSLGSHAVTRRTLQNLGTLRCAQPIASAKTKLLDTPHATDPGSQFRAEQSSVSSFPREPSHSRELLIDGICCQTM